MVLPSHSVIKGNGIQRRDVAIRFFPDTASDPTTIYDPNDDVASIVHTSTGLFTITLNYPVPRILSQTATLQLATVGVIRDVKMSTSNEDAASACTVTVSVTNGASAVDIAADANNSISVHLSLEVSSAGVR